jgi:hypothetical protein
VVVVVVVVWSFFSANWSKFSSSQVREHLQEWDASGEDVAWKMVTALCCWNCVGAWFERVCIIYIYAKILCGGVLRLGPPKLHNSILKDGNIGWVWGTAQKITPAIFQRYVLRTVCSVSHIGDSTH